MKCLSLWQPWASLLVCGLKRIETRSWTIRHRGPLLIHAAKHWEPDLRRMCRTEPFQSALLEAGYREVGDRDWDFPFGAIVGSVNVVECFPTERITTKQITWAINDPVVFEGNQLIIGNKERAFGDYREGRYAFLTNNPVRFDEPIPFKGMQGLFSVDVSDNLFE